MDIDELAEELAYEDYSILEWQREQLTPCVGWQLETFDLDNDWCDDFKEWFADRRNEYLEQAREIIAQEAAQ